MKRTLLFITAVAAGIPAFTQDSGPPPVISIGRESIKEGRGAAHEKVEMDWPRMLRKANFPYHYLALESMSGPSEVWFISAYPTFDAVEKGVKEMAKPAMKSENDMLDSRDGELRSASRTMYAVYRKDLSYRPELAHIGKTRYVMIGSLRVRLGKMESFMQGSKMYLAAEEKANLNTPSLAYEVIAGAPDGLILYIEPMESLKTLDEMPQRQKAFMEAMGPENFGKLMAGTGDVFTSMEASLFSVNPRMSYVSKETEDADPGFWRPKMPAKPATDAKPKEAKEKTGQ